VHTRLCAGNHTGSLLCEVSVHTALSAGKLYRVITPCDNQKHLVIPKLQAQLLRGSVIMGELLWGWRWWWWVLRGWELCGWV